VNLPKITITQTMAITAFVACSIALWQIPINGYQTIWTREPLTYQQPKVPKFYLDPSHPVPVRIAKSIDSEKMPEFMDGRELYLAKHRQGWELCRGWFYGSSGEGLSVPFRELTGKPKDYQAWESAHADFAICDGYASCRSQLSRLLENSTANELRRKIAHSAYWQKVPIWILLLVSFCFTGIQQLVLNWLVIARKKILQRN
jgi:hypothetical protein